MTLLERYILKIAFSAFAACLLALTGVIWITQALRELDLLTGKGQTLFIFLTVTGLSLPALINVIAPVALFMATIYTLNKLNGDSELIVMSAGGMAPQRLLRPFIALAVFISLVVGMISLYLMPASFQELRLLFTRIRADFVATMAKEGQFISLENGITFHYRERAGDALLGIFMEDQRDKAKPIVYLAERGQTVEQNGQAYLVLEKGSVQRKDPNSKDSSIVAFERYAVDLAAFNQENNEVVYKPRERSTTQLLFPDKSEYIYQVQEGRFRAELHDRLSSWLYPLAMMAIAFAALGEARTTRQGRGMAIAMAIAGVVLLRVLGFAASSAVTRSQTAILAVYGVPLAGIALCLLIIFKGPQVRALNAKIQSALRGLGPSRKAVSEGI
ncbi:LPS export ABC transporter permease LptF [Microvirga guangxiensis]|uniref:Lipopolysaccharide export system permease protein n=1 Tax=Microvirga guangxiensis TaxID=549386 RepID=A0A1G5BFA5_9HYPH|nr:LPS export ABC transporter permease LptF [Microvirga guangxiensis]SCX88690.1 lipopolysaccharide export system permease protein [Microvirga guangxiensis]